MKINRWEIPHAILRQTEAAFRVGQHEVFAIWTAQKNEVTSGVTVDRVRVSRCIVPTQTPGGTPQGVFVHIEGRELQRIQLDNFDKSERSIVQLHTHPGSDVSMSGLDRQWEVVRHIGALSIIVPFYGRRGLTDFEGVNVYERDEVDWRLWSKNEVMERISTV